MRNKNIYIYIMGMKHCYHESLCETFEKKMLIFWASILVDNSVSISYNMYKKFGQWTAGVSRLVIIVQCLKNRTYVIQL